MRPFIAVFFFCLCLFSCNRLPESLATGESTKIDRHALVLRHHVKVSDFDPLSSLSVGNGSFAFTVDATGLQTFPEKYENGISLGTMSDWGWHSFPNTGNYRLEESYQFFEVEGRKVPYAVQWNEPGRKQEAASYFRQNPHRLHLGFIGFELQTESGNSFQPADISGITQTLNLWEGQITSSFILERKKTEVHTICHPVRDMIGIQVRSEQFNNELQGFRLRFPYPTGSHTDGAANMNSAEKHQSRVISGDANHAVFEHILDSTVYYVRLVWEGKAEIIQKKPHYYLLKPQVENQLFSFSAEFSQVNKFLLPESFNQVKEAAAIQWKTFWESGGAVDFSETADPLAAELERRVVLSQYLTRIQCAGPLPPQETGLTFNSWHGKFHIEMHWWHGVHWTLWNRTELLEKSLGYYFDIYDKSKVKAETQGYDGVRWPKMTDPSGGDSPSGVGEFLIWQQPHIIYFAELLYRKNQDIETLEKYAPLIFSTADFMADFIRWDATGKQCFLGPPLIPAQESLGKDTTFNPPFEVAYWHWGLSVAQQWLKRMDLPENENWQKVIEGLPAFVQKDGLYLAAESAPDSYSNERYFSDHPMVLGAFGLLPETVPADTAIMLNTLNHIAENWIWPSTWGWDYPMAATAAVRLGKPELAIKLLLKDVQKNTYLANGHNYQDDRLRIYLPGNGGLLIAVAAMCTGFEGNDTHNPGFPSGWKVVWEDISPPF